MPVPSTTAAPVREPAPCIAGFQRSTMLDWPGRVSATLFISGCPFRCPYCHNPELARGTAPRLETTRVLDAILKRRGWIDGVVITGGEPTLHPGLPRLLRELKSRDMPVKLDTNGGSPAVLRALLKEGLVDFVALDVKALPERYLLATGVTDAWESVDASIDVVLESGVGHEFRTTCFPAAVHLDDLDLIAGRLSGAMRYVLQQFRPHRTLDSAASSVAPYEPEFLRRSARRCDRFVPTFVRGL